MPKQPLDPFNANDYDPNDASDTLSEPTASPTGQGLAPDSGHPESEEPAGALPAPTPRATPEDSLPPGEPAGGGRRYATVEEAEEGARYWQSKYDEISTTAAEVQQYKGLLDFVDNDAATQEFIRARVEGRTPQATPQPTPQQGAPKAPVMPAPPTDPYDESAWARYSDATKQYNTQVEQFNQQLAGYYQQTTNFQQQLTQQQQQEAELTSARQRLMFEAGATREEADQILKGIRQERWLDDPSYIVAGYRARKTTSTQEQVAEQRRKAAAQRQNNVMPVAAVSGGGQTHQTQVMHTVENTTYDPFAL